MKNKKFDKSCNSERQPFSTDKPTGTYRFRSWYVPISKSVRTNLRTGYYQFLLSTVKNITKYGKTEIKDC